MSGKDSALDSYITIDSNWLRRFRSAVRRWYRRHGRELPWRGIGDPYRVWISEIMLQQTTVAAVIPYYERFLERFPDVATLAKADESEVLRYWEGLGYYSRARNIHKAAGHIVDELESAFPETPAELEALPGIGRYTAGAISSFAFDGRAPIVEANTLRLYSRLTGYDGDPRSREGQALLWDFAERILPQRNPGEFNQALMDIGATVCSPKDPQCSSCPLAGFCSAFADGSQADIPAKVRRAEVTKVDEVSVAITDGRRFLIRQRQPGERWEGLWDFPRFEVDVPPQDHNMPAATGANVLELVQKQTALDVSLTTPLRTIQHTVTRYRITLHCWLAEWSSGRPGDFCRWIEPEELDDIPLSMTGRKIARAIAEL